MSRKIQIVRQSLAVCLTVLLLVQTMLVGRCTCTENQRSYTTSGCCGEPVSTVAKYDPCEKCSCPSCSGNTDKHDFPVKRCNCQYRSPMGVISHSSSELTNIVQFGGFTPSLFSMVGKDLSSAVMRPPGINDAWSALNACVRLCRFLI